MNHPVGRNNLQNLETFLTVIAGQGSSVVLFLSMLKQKKGTHKIRKYVKTEKDKKYFSDNYKDTEATRVT